MHLFPRARLLEGGGFALVFLGVFLVASAMARARSHPGDRYVARYRAYVERMVRLCFLDTTATAIFRGQAAGLGAGLVLFVLTGEPLTLLVSAMALVGPPLYLQAERHKRIAALDRQADGFILALANSLKAVPNCGAALQGIFPVLRNPVRQEVAVILKEMRVGTSLEQALLNAAGRAKSPGLDSGLSAVLVGRQVGGNLPMVLETTATTMREMNRLAGVVSSKTAEGRAQLWVLALFPFGIFFAFNTVNPGYFDPLQQSLLGEVIAAVAVFLWLGSLVVARKVLEVDL